MQVILMQDVRHTGRRGEIIKVKPGYARNFLLPQGMALEVNPGNLKFFEQQKKKIELKHTKDREAAEARAAEMADVSIEIPKRVGESENLYGSVTTTEIAEALAANGIAVNRRRIDTVGGIKTLGEHIVRIELHTDVTAEVKVQVVPEQ